MSSRIAMASALTAGAAGGQQVALVLQPPTQAQAHDRTSLL
jgi:hypothetical protein